MTVIEDLGELYGPVSTERELQLFFEEHGIRELSEEEQEEARRTSRRATHIKKDGTGFVSVRNIRSLDDYDLPF